jgi:hypothetical protein
MLLNSSVLYYGRWAEKQSLTWPVGVMKSIIVWMRRKPCLYLLLLVPLLACNFTRQSPTARPRPTPASTSIAIVTASSSSAVPSPSATIVPLSDASGLFAGLCDAALLPLAGQTFVIRNQAELGLFFNEYSWNCEESVPAPTFDFSGQVLVGAVENTRGCDAIFTPVRTEADKSNQILAIQLIFEVISGCDYDLLVIFLGGIYLPSPEYDVFVTVETD